MGILIVVDRPKDWPLEVGGVEVVAAEDYLVHAEAMGPRGTKVFNLCREYRYQTAGYYVSLLAEARGHRPHPSLTALLDMKSRSMVRFVGKDLQELIERSLAPLESKEFTLSIYFGRNLARRYDRLSLQLYNTFPAPMLRAFFRRPRSVWRLQWVRPIPAAEIPPGHMEFVTLAATEHFARRRTQVTRKKPPRFNLAILVNPKEELPPSDEKTLRRFVRAGERAGFGVDFLTRDDAGRLAEFDALFIRETTAVNHHTYRLARRAAAEGLVVLDDPLSILRCTNKVYLAEILERHGIPTPRTVVGHRGNIERIRSELGLPCVLKSPDSSFSQGVVKAETQAELDAAVEKILLESDLLIAQEFTPTEFDWRVGILNRKAIYVCRYYMAPKHWQIVLHEGASKHRYGRVETLAVEEAPESVVKTALRAANLIGDGLYGVDLKEIGSRCLVVEVNDNPSIEVGSEDLVLKDDLYRIVMEEFLRRVDERKQSA